MSAFDITVIDPAITTQTTELLVSQLDSNYDEMHRVVPYTKLLLDSSLNDNAIGDYTSTTTNFASNSDTTGNDPNANFNYITQLHVRIKSTNTNEDNEYHDSTVTVTSIIIKHKIDATTTTIMPTITTHEDYSLFGTLTVAEDDTLHATIDFVDTWGKPLLIRGNTNDALIVELTGDFQTLTEHYFNATGYQLV